MPTFFQRNTRLFILAGILCLAALLRFYGLLDSGFKFTDEGYHFYPAVDLFNSFERGTTHFLFLYHALIFWVCLGSCFLGFTYNGALLWGATCGLASVPFLYLFASKLFSKRTALFCALALAFNYYLVFYARTALATGYAVFFFCAFLAVFEWAAGTAGVFAGGAPSDTSPWRRRVAVFAAGVFLGMLEHIRIELGFIAIGLVGALGLTVLLQGGFANLAERRGEILKAWLPLLQVLAYAVAAYLLFFAFIWKMDWVDWKSTWVFYGGHLGFAAGSDHPWGPYLLTDIWHLTGWPFLLVALFGLFSETIAFKKVDVRRKWMLISFWGLSAYLFKTGLVYPRTYIYNVIFLCLYWGVGLRRIVDIPVFHHRKTARFAVFALLAAASFLGELRLIAPLFHKKSRYDQAERFIAARGPGNIHVTHSWPIFELLPFQYQRYVVYDTYAHFSNYRAFCLVLKDAFARRDARYMVLDNNLTYWGNDITMIQQFAATVLPTAVFRNDYGDDWHTCMDAFGMPPAKNMFTNRIMVYDMSEFAKIPLEPIPFQGAERMNEIFARRWAEKASKAKNGVDAAPSKREAIR